MDANAEDERIKREMENLANSLGGIPKQLFTSINTLNEAMISKHRNPESQKAFDDAARDIDFFNRLEEYKKKLAPYVK